MTNTQMVRISEKDLDALIEKAKKRTRRRHETKMSPELEDFCRQCINDYGLLSAYDMFPPVHDFIKNNPHLFGY